MQLLALIGGVWIALQVIGLIRSLFARRKLDRWIDRTSSEVWDSESPDFLDIEKVDKMYKAMRIRDGY